LNQEAADPGTTGGVQQVRGSLPAHAVVRRVVLLELARVQALRKVGEFVDHGVRLGPRHDPPQPPRIEHVAQDRFGTEGVKVIELRLGPRYRGHPVARLDQFLHQPPSDGAGGSRQEESHRCSPPFVACVILTS